MPGLGDTTVNRTVMVPALLGSSVKNQSGIKHESGMDGKGPGLWAHRVEEEWRCSS